MLCGCHSGNAELVRAGLRDVLVEPRRAALIAGFRRSQAGGTGLRPPWAPASPAPAQASLPGLNRGAAAEAAAAPMRQAFALAGVASESFVSPINGPAAKLVR